VVGGSDRRTAGQFVFALGPWFPKFFPELMGKRLRIRTLGHVYYVATPPGVEAYHYPNLPTYNVPGVTGWPALPNDNRGFRIRTGGHQGDDPDNSVRWIAEEYHARPRSILEKYFPELAERPFNETRCCHYESSVDSNFIIDHHPDFDNGWLTGGGSAEAFKQGPVLGEYISGRVLGTENDPDLIESFHLKDQEFEDDARRG
jgi:glycine/D-amino acid oxidase-like deaminating enzyme